MTTPRIEGFDYVGHLGSGGFADVFLYEQQWPRQRVAVKVVRPDVPLTDREKQLFASEANAMARLADHPYIVSVLTAGMTADDGRPYLVMRYCPPPDLGVRVRSHPMAVADAVSTGIKLSSAIQTAHRSGILHRDIKPSNVLVTTYHEPALTDFGIAGHMSEVDSDNDVRVSYPWAPPELLDGRSNGSVASDVYSLGATIWHLLVGRSPFSIPAGDNSTRALSARILHAAPPASQRADVPPALDRLLQQCLAKRPEHRPASALELAQALQRIEAAAGWPRTAIAVEGDLPAAPSPTDGDPVAGDRTVMKPVRVVSAVDTPPEAPDPAEPAGSDRASWVWTAVAVTLVAVLVGALLVRGQDRDEDADPASSTPSHTPAPVLPDVLVQAPIVRGERVDRGALFTWQSALPPHADDIWVWQREDTDTAGRTQATRLLLRTSDPVCLSVRLSRGAESSPSARVCVG